MNRFVEGQEAERLYGKVKDLPIIDYHCHLSPKEIYEDVPFDNIGEIWLKGDHYKWRLMRQAGIEEEYVTGSRPWHDKFIKYAKATELAAGNPLYHWNQMELEKYFNIDEVLTESTAEEIWSRANEEIHRTQMSPRKLIEISNVEYIATTDDVADELEYHARLREERSASSANSANSIKARVTPTFRTDKVLEIYKRDYAEYIEKLSKIAEMQIHDMYSLERALRKRLDAFEKEGAVFTDVGIQKFPTKIAGAEQAERVFGEAVAKQVVTADEYDGFLGYMFVFLGKEYRKRGMVMQWHLAAQRNVNTALFDECGADSGGDCIGDAIQGQAIEMILDKINTSGGLPETIIYTLNPSMATQLSTIAGSYRNVKCGAAWWFNDHKEGIKRQIETIAETANIGMFPGMLTDSRSFLSYARHDYFRRILCSVIGKWVDSGEFAGGEISEKLARAISYSNIKNIIAEKQKNRKEVIKEYGQ